MMHRFFIYNTSFNYGDVLPLNQDDSAHVARVLRLRENDEILVCNGACLCHVGKIINFEGKSAKQIFVEIVSKTPKKILEPKAKITLFQAVPKAGKLDLICQKGTEVGISGFSSFYSERCISKPKTTKQEKENRFEKIIYEAAKQSRRGIVPTFEQLVLQTQIFERLKTFDFILLAWEESTNSLKQQLKIIKQKTAQSEVDENFSLAIIIGPEGGFEKTEAAEFERCGAKTISLGSRILRTETAGLVLAANILYEFE